MLLFCMTNFCIGLRFSFSTYLINEVAGYLPVDMVVLSLVNIILTDNTYIRAKIYYYNF